MQNKQSGMSPSFCALLSVTLCCPDYCLLLLFDNNITIPFVLGVEALLNSVPPKWKRKKMYEKYVCFFGFFFCSIK